MHLNESFSQEESPDKSTLPMINEESLNVSKPLKQSSNSSKKTASKSKKKKSSSPILYGSGYPDAFVDQLQETIDAHVAKNQTIALLVISIDNLSMIMSGYGHEASEQVIDEIMSSLDEFLPKNHHCERIQKDQIGIILQHLDRENLFEITQKSHHMVHGYGHESALGSLHVLSSTVCIQIPEITSDAETALDQAFIYLNNKQGIIIPELHDSPHVSANSRQEMGLANYLSRAIKENRLRMAYQPIINSQTGAVSHYEALLRNVGDDGIISSAGALIPIAERMGLIHIIDQLVLEKVVEELHSDPNVSLAFNVSNLTTDDSQWLDRLEVLIGDQPDVASRMIVEITETAIHRDLRKTAYFVATIQSLGAQVALDDFGSGYTSFRQLKSLSVDMVKIDGAFIRDLVDNADNRFFVKTLLDFTKGFGLRSVAEYVENGEIAKMLMELGVEYMQGYYFGRPENHRSWLQEDK